MKKIIVLTVLIGLSNGLSAANWWPFSQANFWRNVSQSKYYKGEITNNDIKIAVPAIASMSLCALTIYNLYKPKPSKKAALICSAGALIATIPQIVRLAKKGTAGALACSATLALGYLGAIYAIVKTVPSDEEQKPVSAR